jgi:protein-S-isoprenylcysteine O-methyltransferase Ste14
MTISGVEAMAIYFAFFALVHSLLADPRFKSRVRNKFGNLFDRWQRLAYTVLALIMTLPFVYILAYLPDRILYIVPWPGSGLMAAGQILAALGLLASLRQTGIFYFLGLEQLKNSSAAGGLITSGFYCHIRNPLFFFATLFLWLSPFMTANLLAFNILATVYFYIGARHEERSLHEEFGPEYEAYRERVPMFLPRLSCRNDAIR